MTKPTRHHLTANSLDLHYLEAGQGDPVLLLHGFPTSSHLYRNILPELGKTHRAIALDLPGYGLSEKPLDIARLCAARSRHASSPISAAVTS